MTDPALELPRRVAVTVAVVAATVAAGRLPLPGLDLELLRMLDLEPSGWSVVSLGLTPWVTAALLVEIGALTRERWRRLRLGGPAGRARLDRAVRTCWLVVCSIQALAMATSMEALQVGASPLVLEPGGAFRIVAVLSLVAGSALFGFAVSVIGQWGFGNGFAVLLGWPLLVAVVTGLTPLDLVRDEHRHLILPVGVAVLGYAWLTREWLRRWIVRDVVRAAAAGVIPATTGAAVADAAAVVNPGLAGSWFALALGGAALATPIFVFLFGRPEVVARSVGRPMAAVRAALPPAIAIGLAVSLLLLVGDFRGPARALSPAALQPVALLTLFAMAWDLHAEWVARRALGPVVSVWPLQRVHDTAPALAALETAGIPAHVRGLRLRQLFHFFAPYVPIEVLVAPEQAPHARQLLAAPPAV